MLSIDTSRKTRETTIDSLCKIFENSSIKEEKSITTFDFSPYITTKENTIDFHAFVLDCGYIIAQAIKDL